MRKMLDPNPAFNPDMWFYIGPKKESTYLAYTKKLQGLQFRHPPSSLNGVLRDFWCQKTQNSLLNPIKLPLRRERSGTQDGSMRIGLMPFVLLCPVHRIVLSYNPTEIVLSRYTSMLPSCCYVCRGLQKTRNTVPKRQNFPCDTHTHTRKHTYRNTYTRSVAKVKRVTWPTEPLCWPMDGTFLFGTPCGQLRMRGAFCRGRRTYYPVNRIRWWGIWWMGTCLH